MFRTACKHIGMTDVSPHNLRHTHASKLVAAGVDVVEVARWLGDSVGTVQSVYLHEWNADQRREQQRALLQKLYPGRGSELEATERNGSRPVEVPAYAEVANLQGMRGAAR